MEAAGATIPVYWDPAFLQAYRTFVRAFARHVGHDPDVALVEAGIGFGGETLPETNASAQDVATWTRDGYSDARWLATVETIASYYGRAFRRIPVYALVDRTFFDGSGTDFERVLSWVTSRRGWGLQDDGLTATQTLEPAWSTVPLALEQLEPTSTSGDCLCQDVANAVTRLRGQYLIVYKSDVEDPANATALAEAARAVGSVAPAP